VLLMSVCRARAMPKTNPRHAPSPQHHPAPRAPLASAVLDSCRCSNNLLQACLHLVSLFTHRASHPPPTEYQIASPCASRVFGLTTRPRMQAADSRQSPPRTSNHQLTCAHRFSFPYSKSVGRVLTCLRATLVSTDSTPSPSRPAGPGDHGSRLIFKDRTRMTTVLDAQLFACIYPRHSNAIQRTA
jgi:hypothetical protein